MAQFKVTAFQHVWYGIGNATTAAASTVW